MADRIYDAIVIGTGQAGPSLARRLVEAGMKVAVIERKRFGGTCVNTGCTPTKTMIASARAAHMARRAAEYGVLLEGAVRVDMKRVKARKDALVNRSSENIESSLRKTKNVTVYQDHARFIGPRRLQVGEWSLTADRVFINVGARARVPDLPGIKSVPFLTDSSMMAVDILPGHLILLGGSYVGLEFAQMYRRFGSEVTVVETAPRLIPKEDDDVADAVRDILEGEGITVVTSAPRYSVTGTDDEVRLKAAEGAPAEIEGTHLLLGVGRVPNTGDLGLDEAGIEVEAQGYIRVDDELRTSAEGVWALGDCNGRGAFTHTAYNDYEIVVGNLLDGQTRRASDRILTYALYTDPPLGRAGMTEREVRESGRDALIARMPMADVARARERSETQGFMKILVDAGNQRILGAALLGIEADEVIHVILDVMYSDRPYTLISRAMHIHPTVAELLPTLLERLEPLEA